MPLASGVLVSALGTNSRALWYLTRGSGVVALLLLTGVVLLGLLTATRWSRPGWPRFLTVDLHRNLSLLTVAFVVLHVLTAVADTFAPISLLNSVIPFTGSYRPVWVGFGALGFDLLLALVVTSLARTRIPHRIWRGVHWLAYACWPVAVVHGLGTGSDAALGWSQLLTWSAVAAVAAALAWRLVADRGRAAGARLAGGFTAAVAVVAIAAFATTGPLRPGWARRAGTPQALLSHPSSAATGAAPASLPLPYSGTFSGTLAQQQLGEETEQVVLAGAVSASPAGQLRLVLDGQPTENGGVSMTASQVSFVAGSTRWSGRVVALSGASIEARLTDPAGASAVLQLVVSINGSAVSGQVRMVTG